jgi:hypothetical protein
MAVKSKGKTKKNVKAKARRVAKPKKGAVKKARSAGKMVSKSKRPVRPAALVKSPEKSNTEPFVEKPLVRAPVKFLSKPAPFVRPLTTVVKRVVNPMVERKPVVSRTPRVHHFAYMKAPGLEHAFDVGNTVEVFCDHEKNRERIRGWVRGTVVQVDNKMVAVQFRSNVYLTDGWMVPDRILWYPVNSEHIRPVPGKKPVKKDFIPDY